MIKTWNNWGGLAFAGAVVWISQIYLQDFAALGPNEGAGSLLAVFMFVLNMACSAGFLGILTGAMDMDKMNDSVPPGKFRIAVVCMIVGAVLAATTIIMVTTPGAPMMLFSWSIRALMILGIILAGFGVWTQSRSISTAS